MAFLVAVCCLTWVVVLWWWQRTGHSAEVEDLVLYLVLLPLLIATVLLGLRWAWQRRAAAQTAAAAAAASGAAAGAAAGAGAPVPQVTGDELARQAVTQLVLASVRCVSGDQVGDLLDAAAAGKPLPQPDPLLGNDEGLPVLCARIPDKVLDLETVRADLTAVLEGVRAEVGAHHEPDDHVWRALAALAPVLEVHRDWLWSLHQAGLAALEDGGASLERLPPSQRPPLPMVRVLLGCPPHWGVLEQALLKAWAVRSMDTDQVRLSHGYTLAFSVLAGTGEEFWLRADQTSHGAARSPWLLVAACDSELSDARIEALAAGRHLYDASRRPGGCMPGEAAAAVLLAAADWTPPEDFDLAPVRLHRPALLRRDKPVDAAGRVAHVELAGALQQSLSAALVEPQQVGMLVCDADLHSNRSAELYGLAVESLSQLDPVEDVRLLGRITGRTGAAAPLLLIAAAADAARSTKKPTLALSMGDALLRMALVLKPSVEGEPDAA